MNKIKFILVSVLVSGLFSVYAQDKNEAYYFSNNVVQGTARSMGFGGTLGSVGGDFSCLSVNPAGIGIYRSSEVSFTPSLIMNGTSSQYLGNTTTNNNIAFNISHLGIVFTDAPKGKRYENRNWKSVSFALGINKTADFNHKYTYQGKNTTSSATQVFESDANLNPGNDSLEGTLGFLGYQSYLLNKDTAGKFHTIVPFQGGIDQQKTVHTSGASHEYVLSFGGNYKEKLLLGITIGIPVVNYHYNSTYSESVSAGNNLNTENFNSFSYGKSLDVTGAGINAKVGVIYKLTDFLRLGAAFHSPTFYNFSEVFSPSVNATVNGNTYSLTDQNYSLGSQFDYSLTTPWKAILSATFIIKSLGFITADYEYMDYSTMRYMYPLGYDDYNGKTFQEEENAINQEIKNTFKSVSNFRLGAEVKLGKLLMVRAGAGYYGNPYQKTDTSSQRIDMSVGLGFHFNRFFTDIAFVHSIYQTTEQPYVIDYTGVVSGTQATIPQVKINYELNNLALTIGYKF